SLLPVEGDRRLRARSSAAVTCTVSSITGCASDAPSPAGASPLPALAADGAFGAAEGACALPTDIMATYRMAADARGIGLGFIARAHCRSTNLLCYNITYQSTIGRWSRVRPLPQKQDSGWGSEQSAWRRGIASIRDNQ